MDINYSMVKTVVAGTIVKDPEMSATQNGTWQVRFSVKAKMRVFNSADQKSEYITSFHSIVCFSKPKEEGQGESQAETLNRKLYKDCPVLVEYQPDVMVVESTKDGKVWKNVKPRMFENQGYADTSFGGQLIAITILGFKEEGQNGQADASKPVQGRMQMRGAAPAGQPAAPAAAADPAATAAEESWDE